MRKYVYLISTFDGIKEEFEIIEANNQAHDVIEMLKDIYAPEDLEITKIDIEDLIEVDSKSGAIATLSYAYNSIMEIAETLNDDPFLEDMTRDEKINHFNIDIKKEYLKYQGVEIVENYINDIRAAIYDYLT